jgi:hypothetical protein
LTEQEYYTAQIGLYQFHRYNIDRRTHGFASSPVESNIVLISMHGRWRQIGHESSRVVV